MALVVVVAQGEALRRQRSLPRGKAFRPADLPQKPQVISGFHDCLVAARLKMANSENSHDLAANGLPRVRVCVCVCCPASAPPEAPSSHGSALEALEQRRAKYVEASNQAKASGDDRKARMHDRISKVSVGPLRLRTAMLTFTQLVFTVTFKGLGSPDEMISKRHDV